MYVIMIELLCIYVCARLRFSAVQLAASAVMGSIVTAGNTLMNTCIYTYIHTYIDTYLKPYMFVLSGVPTFISEVARQIEHETSAKRRYVR